MTEQDIERGNRMRRAGRSVAQLLRAPRLTRTAAANAQWRMPLHLVTFHADLGKTATPVHPNANLEANEYIDMIGWLYRSAHLFHPGVKLTVLTTERTSLRGLDVPFERVDGPCSPDRVMLDRAIAQVAFVEQYDFSAPLLLLDSDILINGDLSSLLSRNFDIALTWREQKMMPLNGGVIFVSCRRPEIVRSFFRRYLAIYKEHYADQKQWFGDQMALRDAVGLQLETLRKYKEFVVTSAEGGTCLLVPSLAYNRSPDNMLSDIVEPIQDSVVLHFKGERKRLMKLYWQAHLEGRTTPLPFHLQLPWRLRRARAAQQALREAAKVEDLALIGQK